MKRKNIAAGKVKKTTSANHAGSPARKRLYNQCKALANNPDILAALGDALRERGVVGDLQNFLIVYLVVVTRLFPYPTSAVLKGPTGVGKSAALDAPLSLCPPSAFHILTSASDKALFYSSENFEHRIIVMHEATGMSEEVSHSMRVLQSQGYITREITVQVPGGGRETTMITKKGPIGLLTTTTALQLHPENETRALSLTVPDSEERTNAILLSMTGEEKLHPVPKDWHALQEWLAVGPTEVTVPFDKSVAALTRGIVPRVARDFRNMMSLVEAHALLHLKTRARKSGKVVAKIRDYRAVWKLVKDVIAVGVEASVAPETRETVNAVSKLKAAGNQTVTLADLSEELGLHKTTAWRRVMVAIDRGYLHNLGETRGRKSFRIVTGEPLPKDIKILPTPNEVLAHYKAAAKKQVGQPAPKAPVRKKWPTRPGTNAR